MMISILILRMIQFIRRFLFALFLILTYVNIPLDLRMEVGSFLSFADFFFDGFVALVHLSVFLLNDLYIHTGITQNTQNFIWLIRLLGIPEY